MTLQQKSACYQLVVALLAAMTYVALLHSPWPVVAPAAFALLALIGLVPRFFPREVRDEREVLIANRAAVVGGGASYLFLVGFYMIVWAARFRHDPPTVEVGMLPLIALGACVIMLTVRSAAVLVLHRRSLDQT